MHHQPKFNVFGKTLHADRSGAGIGSQSHENTRVVNLLQISLRNWKRFLFHLSCFALARFCFVTGAGDHLKYALIECRAEERFVHPGRRISIREGEIVQGQGWDVSRVMLLHIGEQRVIHLAVANAVREHIDAISDQRARILKVIQVCGHSQPVLVSFVDDRPVDFRRYQLRVLAIEIVQPQLIEIRFHRRLNCNRLSRFFRSAGPQNISETHRRGRCAVLCAEAVAGGVDICSRQLASSRGFTDFCELRPVSAHR